MVKGQSAKFLFFSIKLKKQILTHIQYFIHIINFLLAILQLQDSIQKLDGEMSSAQNAIKKLANTTDGDAYYNF